MTVKTPSELSDLIHGEVIVESDADYEDARQVHNGMIDKRPAVIVRAANAGRSGVPRLTRTPPQAENGGKQDGSVGN